MSVFTDVCEKINKIQEDCDLFLVIGVQVDGTPTVIKVPKNPKMFIVPK